MNKVGTTSRATNKHQHCTHERFMMRVENEKQNEQEREEEERERKKKVKKEVE